MLDREAVGVVIAAKRQWWLKINTKRIRLHALDGAVFPYVIKVKYMAGGKEYVKRKWIGAGKPVPKTESTVRVLYCEAKPSKAKILS